jgi:hypothetical protein
MNRYWVREAERGDMDKAKSQWAAVLPECPGDREALTRVGGLGS